MPVDAFLVAVVAITAAINPKSIPTKPCPKHSFFNISLVIVQPSFGRMPLPDGSYTAVNHDASHTLFPKWPDSLFQHVRSRGLRTRMLRCCWRWQMAVLVLGELARVILPRPAQDLSLH